MVFYHGVRPKLSCNDMAGVACMTSVLQVCCNTDKGRCPMDRWQRRESETGAQLVKYVKAVQ